MGLGHPREPMCTNPGNVEPGTAYNFLRKKKKEKRKKKKEKEGTIGIMRALRLDYLRVCLFFTNHCK